MGDLYKQVPTQVENIPVLVETFPIDDLKPDEEDIEWGVWRVIYNRSGRTSGIIEEQFCKWLREAQKVAEVADMVMEEGEGMAMNTAAMAM